MANIETIRQAGISPTRGGLISNPVRGLLWPFVRPWLQAVLDVARNDTARSSEVALRSSMAAVEKDMLAMAHRLASMEVQLAEARGELALARAASEERRQD